MPSRMVGLIRLKLSFSTVRMRIFVYILSRAPSYGRHVLTVVLNFSGVGF